MRIYKIDTTIPMSKYKPDKRVPFHIFYLVPTVDPNCLRRIAPYSLLVPLTMDYAAVIKDRDLNFDELVAKKYQVMVPIHMKRCGRSSTELAPTYVTNRSWWTVHQTKLLPRFLPEDTTLLTPEGPLTPMCLPCENHLQHIVGECTIGSEACLQHLKIKFTPTPFKDVVAEPCDNPLSATGDD